MSTNFKDKTVAVIGLARTGLPLVEYLDGRAKKLILADANDQVELPEKYRKQKNIEIILGQNYLSAVKKSDIAFISPGISRAKIDAGKAKLTSEIELIFDLLPNQIIGVTGSNGKTTTVSLIHHILKTANIGSVVGGNIGNALIDDLPKIKKSDVVILELSSFQLEYLEKSPHIAVVLNVSSNHLDRHGNLKKYIQAKSNILKHQKSKDLAILNADDREISALVNKTPAEKVFFTVQKSMENAYHPKAGNIAYNYNKEEQEICSYEGWQLPGKHNLANLLAALAAVRRFKIKQKLLEKAISTFKPLEHRIELVTAKRGVAYYNDSKATTPDATIAALNSFGKKIILIAGGSDKDMEYFGLAQIIPRQVKKLILMGNTGPKIAAEIKKHFPDFYENVLECFDQELDQCLRAAQKASMSGDVVLFSPASASFDQYKDFEERGKVFKKLVQKL